jgi:predicted CXXCH cytochrome family protein
MRRLALLFAGGALWLLLAAAPAFADGGPHQLAVNSGTQGLAGDCAACHRAHTAQAADLLKESMPGLCLSCHDGTGATTNVEDGIQYVPTGDATFQQSSVLGALRGGGFEYALIDSSNASRLTYWSRGGVKVIFSAAPSGSVDVVFGPVTGFSGATVSISSLTAATIQTATDAAFGTTTAYPGNGTAGTHRMTVTVSGTTVTFTPQNDFKLIPITAPTLANNTTGVTVTVDASGLLTGGDGHVGVLTTALQVTSSHEGAGTVWGNGPQGQGNAGASGVSLECTNCHNPHGNGQYRILNTLPGEDWANDAVTASTTLAANVTTGSQTTITVTSAVGFSKQDFVISVGTEQMLVTGGQGTTTWTVTRGYNATVPTAPAAGTQVTMVTQDWTPPANAVAVADVGVTTSTKNYTVLPGLQASDVVGYDPDQGDYWRYKYDPTGASNFTDYYLSSDPMNSGWNGTTLAPSNSAGALTEWCISCHTRYNGYSAAGTTSLVAATPTDDTFMFKHGTTRIGCEQCHVSHGSNALMEATFSSTYKFPDGTAEDSALLKVDNRGTCNLCHDPTGTVLAGTPVGDVPGDLVGP